VKSLITGILLETEVSAHRIRGILYYTETSIWKSRGVVTHPIKDFLKVYYVSEALYKTVVTDTVLDGI